MVKAEEEVLANGDTPCHVAKIYDARLPIQANNPDTIPISVEKNISPTGQTYLERQLLLDAIHLPRPELMLFSGDLFSYWAFRRVFDDHTNISNSSKFTCLLQFCTDKGKARI